MIVAAVKEVFTGERMVALTPAAAASLIKNSLEVRIQAGAGMAAGFPDAAYEKVGAEVVENRISILQHADILVQVHALGSNPELQRADLTALKRGVAIIGFADPLTDKTAMRTLAQYGVTLLAMELVPRITRAQSMDALSSLASLAGYKAVLLGAERLGKIFPMMITAAGTITPAKVFVIGAGVAGLQAIATARRLGAQVSAFDVRPAVKEQVQSLGARFVELPLQAAEAQTPAGYARQQTEEEQRRQRELMTRSVGEADVVISTAAVPGKKAPVLISEEMVATMDPGSVIIDLAAARGGNCALTRPDEIVDYHGVTILGPTNLPATLPVHASQVYANNMVNILKHLAKNGQWKLDDQDQITHDMLVMRDGNIVNERVREILELPAVLATAASPAVGATAG
ncbi:MAG: Re/Si-specific NAD(P)(+) transhydrogenase subunit alpha [Planctomycetia bacterium]|nr:Re/Si-specific NAD(P)(+) transhydrogenase subunit alpha [Planctomycetia bacterium]